MVLPCTVHDSLTLVIFSLPPRPFLNPVWSIGVSCPIYNWSCFWIILKSILFASGNSAMVQLFVHFVTSPFLGEGMKTDISCFTCPWFRRNILTPPGAAVVILMSSHYISSQYTFVLSLVNFLSHTQYNFSCRKNQENNEN